MAILRRDTQNPVFRYKEVVPQLRDDQVRRAMTFIPTDYWVLSCWTCREDGHQAFRCPFLGFNQRLYFEYRYCLYQEKSNPTMECWVEDRHTTWDVGERLKEPRKFDVSRGGRGIRGCGRDGYHGEGRGNGGWAPGGRGRSMYPTDHRGCSPSRTRTYVRSTVP